MDEYLKTMGNYSPNIAGTGKMMSETEIIEISGTPQMTAVTSEKTISEDVPYLAPKTIEVRRYALKK